ncbi:hypothetical protein TSUD_201300 [Trifolium subterraneum]|uniref:Uncharacterized protein n=1 Tax=Trifolium subterraneum TaxID=3900 RepID=A0A2Z6LTW3_TRISU|nr:hypothetical protein TSUD_201300 [Trifolium subterraneum]
MRIIMPSSPVNNGLNIWREHCKKLDDDIGRQPPVGHTKSLTFICCICSGTTIQSSSMDFSPNS